MRYNNVIIERVKLVDLNLQDLKEQIILLELSEDIDIMYLLHTFEKCISLMKQNRFHLASFWYEQAILFKCKAENLNIKKLILSNICFEIDWMLDFIKKNRTINP